MTMHATGTFEVKLDQLGIHMADEQFGRMSIDKVLRGGLEGTSRGEMLSVRTAVAGSGAYVAIERITGALNGRRGSFVVHHTGVMTRGAPQLTITMVPDSGTDELTGITGTMAIRIVDGKHFYDIDYDLPAEP